MLTRPFNGTFHFQNLYYTFLTRVDIGIILSEYVRQRKTNSTYTWNLKNKWTKSNINTDKGLVVTRGEEVAGEGDMGEGDHLYGDSWQLDSLWRQCTQMSNYGKNLHAMQEIQVQSLGQEDPLEKGMTTHSRITAWRFPCTEEPAGLQSIGLQRAGPHWATNTISTHMKPVYYIPILPQFKKQIKNR